MKVELEVNITEADMERVERMREMYERRLEDIQGFKTAYEVYTEKTEPRDGTWYFLNRLKLRYLDTCIQVFVMDRRNPERYLNEWDGRKEELEYILSLVGISEEEMQDIESKARQYATRIMNTPRSVLMEGMGYARERV